MGVTVKRVVCWETIRVRMEKDGEAQLTDNEVWKEGVGVGDVLILQGRASVGGLG